MSIVDFENRSTWVDDYSKMIIAGKFKEAQEFLLEIVPKGRLIYKYYRGINRDFNTIKKNRLWLCNAKNFNDPYDCAFLINCKSKSVYPPEESEIAMSEYNQQRQQNLKSAGLQSTMFVSCFSEDEKSILMWSHYSNNHKGICIGYDLRELIKRAPIFPVVYTNKMMDFKNENQYDRRFKGSLFKFSSWEYEREWRVIYIDENAKDKAGKLIDFLQPTKIYIGCQEEKAIHDFHFLYNSYRSRGIKCTPQDNEFPVDINDVLKYAKENKITYYENELQRDDFKLMPIKVIL